MKILLVHYRFFISGGPERYMFNIMDILQKNGHEVIPFSVKHNQNSPSKYSEYFLDAVGSGNEIYGHEYKKNLTTISKVFSRMIYSFEAKRKLKKLIADTKPDLVYILQFQNKISCSVVDAAYEMNVPIVQRISDFGHICITNIFYHYQSQQICEKCLNGSKINAIEKKCANNSLVNSFIKVLALKVQDFRKTKSKISQFIIPSKFTVEKFVEFGVPRNIINYIPTFFNAKNSDGKTVIYEDFFLYVGRVDPDKGLLTLVKAFVDSPYKLVIVGSSIEGYDNFLKEFIKDKKHNITFTGKLEFSEIRTYLERCLCTICPSEWYDNFPNAVLESYAYEKAVIASYLGSLTDLVSDYATGRHFKAADVNDLRSKVKWMYENREEAKKMGENSYSRLVSEYSTELHYLKLMEVFNNVKDNHKLKSRHDS